jgi:hypothetical protein
MTILVIAFPDEKEDKQFYRVMAIVCVSVCMVLTNVAHFMNIAVIRPFIENEVSVPDYFQIGKYPSALMAIDYLGWGLFMGLAFICSSRFTSLEVNLKKFILICGFLCLAGFIGFMFNVNIWYIAPIGYGIGTFVICIKLLSIKSRTN